MSSIIKILIGTYTEDSSSKGIYLYSFNQENADFIEVGSINSINPSFQYLSEDKKHFYSLNELDNGKQSVISYMINDDNKITKLTEISTDYKGQSGAHPCNLLVFKNYLISSNYTGGSFTLYQINSNTKELIKSCQYFSYSEKSHFHCAILSPDKKYIFISDLGCDIIHRFTITDNDSVPLTEHKIVYEYKNKTQAGPRHMVFSKDGLFLYVLCELDDLLSVFKYKNGDIKHIESLKAYDCDGRGSADIHFSKDGEFLYTSHRLKGDGISIFKVDKKEGKLNKIGFVKTGIHPRNFNISPNGKYLLCGCRDSNVIEIYELNNNDGSLKKIDKEIKIPKPSCIQFIY